jgi:predicted deacylase
VSANIHGNEVNGIVVAHRLIAALEAAVESKTLVGTVVVYPSLNPTGLVAGTRTPSYSFDANRLWPSQEPKPDSVDDAPGDDRDDTEDELADPLAEFVKWDEPSAQEQAWIKLLDEWAGAGFDYHIDLHTAGTPLNSTWTYLDRYALLGRFHFSILLVLMCC